MSEEPTPTPTPTPTPAPEGLQGLSEEFRDNPALKDFTDVNQLAKAFTDTKRMVGNMIRIPGEDASEADIQGFREKLLTAPVDLIPKPNLDDPAEAAKFFLKVGAPENPEGYTPVEGMPEERFGALAKLAHEAGITDKQFQQVAGQMLASDTATNQAVIEQREQGLSALKGEWGEAYDQKFARAQRLAEATKAPEALVQAMQNGAVDAATLRWMDSVAASLGGEGSNLIEVDNVTENTREELEHQRDELTRKLQSDDRMPASERERLIAKNVELNSRILALAS